MSRRKSENYVRDIGLDAVFGDRLIQKMINVVMERGKKTVARAIVYGAMDVLVHRQNGSKEAALEQFKIAFQNVAPQVEVRSRRVGGGVMQIPRPVPERRKESLALRWLIKAAKSRPNKTMAERLGFELIDASQNKGGAVQESINTRKMAEANRAFAQHAW